VIFFYNRKGVNSVEDEWKDIDKTLSERTEQFIGRAHGVREVVLEAIGGETDPEKKLRKLYARIQQVRNLSFERPRSEEERKKENLQKNDGAGDVLQHGYGSDGEITQAFVSMARSAGFDASLVQMADRKK